MLYVIVTLLCCIALVFAAETTNPLAAVTKAEKLRKLSALVNSTLPLAIDISYMKWSTPHNFSSPEVILASAMSATYVPNDAIHFAGTARKSGFKGDIVIAIMAGVSDLFLKKMVEYNVTVYAVHTKCDNTVPSDVRCVYGGRKDVPATFFKHYFFQFFALQYPASTYFMASDFRDVIFQSNPFNYKSSDWREPIFQLTVFQESHPNRVINRCPVTGTSLQNCYDKEVFRSIGSNTISTSGIVFGTRDAIAGYSFLVSKQYEPKNGRGHNQTSNENCLGFSADQTFHNYLLYTNYLSKFMTVKIFQQGEGPANTLGGFYGEKKILKALLSEWKIVRGEAPYKYVHNWNGELSPVVHQLDRFATSELTGGYRQHLAVMQHL